MARPLRVEFADAGMRQLNGDYAGQFNRRHRRRGPLMQGRCKAVLVEDQSHWMVLSRYVHLNPVRAELSRRAEAAMRSAKVRRMVEALVADAVANH
jgi:hypothetical protein